MVYDDSRWVQRLKSMGVWNETEARQRAEESRRNTSTQQNGDHFPRTGIGVDGVQHAAAATFDKTVSNSGPESGLAGQSRRLSMTAYSKQSSLNDGFNALTLEATAGSQSSSVTQKNDSGRTLAVLKSVRSIRGAARQEYGKVYRALAPYFIDVVDSDAFADLLVFKAYREPEDQARLLDQLTNFARSDFSSGLEDREKKLKSVIEIFENAALREFWQGYNTANFDGAMRKYAYVLHTLNGGGASIEYFVRHNQLLTIKERFGNPNTALKYGASSRDVLRESRNFLDNVSTAFNGQIHIVGRVFPPEAKILLPFLKRVGNDVLSPYYKAVFDELHHRNMDVYLAVVSGAFAQCLQFADSVQLSAAFGKDFSRAVDTCISQIFELHVDLYLAEELVTFQKKSEAQVNKWDQELSEQAASAESYLMSNINRQADKRDFMSSFKKVIMMPVNVLPSFGSKQSTAKALVNSEGSETPEFSTRPGTPSMNGTTNRTSVTLQEAPTSEFAAKAAIMNSKLEGIKSLFSIEVALNLVHSAKASIERAAQFAKLGGEPGLLAQKQCQAIFVLLLKILGDRHVKAGFDKAISHLANYNATEQSDQGSLGVAPLITFLELVNVGDLIQQMVDVFYEQELMGMKLVDRNDFLDPAGKEKKKFEQMLDERVAAGLNKGIDALMEEVDYICATTQTIADFNPEAAGGKKQIMDIGPSETAQRVVEVVSSHTNMLTGSTDKNLLDVFNQEVGLRLFTALCKHLKRQRISVEGSIRLIR